jgi:hypothetical protein
MNDFIYHIDRYDLWGLINHLNIVVPLHSRGDTDSITHHTCHIYNNAQQ